MIMQQIREWLVARYRDIVTRLAGDDARKALMVHAAGIFLAGLFVGCLLMALAQPLGAIVTLTGGVAIGYAVRSYVSHRRRQAFRRQGF
ncbi:MAG: hypothetical protein DI527_23595 [Chelatococcus sp.]|nr:MAG: hypothetical protein DI527_23595 [Chelatococcus sp.]